MQTNYHSDCLQTAGICRFSRLLTTSGHHHCRLRRLSANDNNNDDNNNNKWSKKLDSRQHHRHTWMVKLYSQVAPVCSHLIHAFLDTPESTSQTTSQSVQLFLNSSRQSVPIIYYTSPSNLPLHMGALDPLQNMVPWAHPSPQPKWHLDQFGSYGRAYDCNRQINRPCYSRM